MSKPLRAEAEIELAQLTAFVEGVWAGLIALGHFDALPDPLALFRSGAAAVESNAGRAALLRGLRMAANDVLHMTADLPAEEVRALDQRLEDAGAPGLTRMRRRLFARKLPRLLARGRLRTEEEYYLLVEELNDVSGPFTEEQRRTASGMVAEYEARRGNRSA